MNTYIEIHSQLVSKKLEAIQAKGKTKKVAYDIVYEEATLQGTERKTKFIAGTCPKDALKAFRKFTTQIEGKVNVVQLNSPTKKKGWVVYKVYDNTHILR